MFKEAYTDIWFLKYSVQFDLPCITVAENV